MSEVHLDDNGSAPSDLHAAGAMVPVLSAGVGNTSSVHQSCHRRAADEAREHAGVLARGQLSGVVFTAGAAGANHLALRRAAKAGPVDRLRLLISPVGYALSGADHLLRERVTDGGYFRAVADGLRLRDVRPEFLAASERTDEQVEFADE